MAQFTITISNFVAEKINNSLNNQSKSGRIEELILKGIMQEQEERLKAEFLNKKTSSSVVEEEEENVVFRIMSRKSLIKPETYELLKETYSLLYKKPFEWYLYNYNAHNHLPLGVRK